jgi:hypothetical protein
MTAKPADRIAVVHLVRAKNDLAPFKRFMASYANCPAGVDHQLVLLLKGFKDPASKDVIRELARDWQPDYIEISDFGFDLRAYGFAAKTLEYSHLCFLNSHSEILDRDWLLKLYNSIQMPHAGLVGATGSWESMYSNALRRARQLPSFNPAHWLELVRVAGCRAFFRPFPNYHVRTNAFIMPRGLMLRLWPAFLPLKRAAYLFENGRNSLTARVLRGGLKVSVVGRDGVAYPPESWNLSRTFRSADQSNLLVADNQTRQFHSANPKLKQQLSQASWGA